VTTVIVNGEPRSGPPGMSLLGYLRGPLGLTGAKPGCGEGECGACTVLVDGNPALSCQTQLEEVDGRSIVTIEGLGAGGLHPMQRALIEEGASQCGYCTPGMALRGAALLVANADPDDREIAEAMSPSVCRCGCYPSLTRAVHRAAVLLREGAAVPFAPAPPERPSLTAPRRPWDLSEPQEREWFDLLDDGLAVVLPPQASGGWWAMNGGAWLHLAPSGRVTAFSGKVDVGQDNATAFRMLVAEELIAPLGDVQVVLGDTDLCPFDIGTFGSRSMPDAGQALRRAAAGARRTLVVLAAERWGVPARNVSVSEPGVLRGPDGATLSYAEVVRGARRLEVLTGEPELLTPDQWRLVGHGGHAPSRIDAVTGTRTFVSDLHRPGMRYGAVLRPPVRGATLRRVDSSDLPNGVTLVRDGDFVGVVAGNVIAARHAVAELRAYWSDPPTGPTDVAEYLRANPVDGEGWDSGMDEVVGDPEAALAGAIEKVEATYTTEYLAHVPLETRAAVAEWTGDRLTVWVGTQVPFGVRERLADALGLDRSRIRVIVPPTGSGFGGKHAGEVATEAARLARAVDAPVNVHWSRAEEFQWGYVRPMAVIDIRAALDADGDIVAWDLLDINAGTAGIGFPYETANRRLRYQAADSPMAQGSYRALAATANHFARESHIDELARAAGVDPLEFRLRHLDDERLITVVQAAAEHCSRPTRDHGGRYGIGIAAGLEKNGRVATCAEVRVDEHDTVEVTRLVTAYECGAIVNPDTVRNQIEGGTIMALGGALFEQLALDHGHIADPALAAYRVPRFSDAPTVEVVLIDRSDLPSAGAGETPIIAVAPAIANAIFDATGRRLRSLPLVPDGTLP
jgi:nicotinate dehydrogenase subunit B